MAIKLVETAGQVKKKDQEGENADKRHKFTLNLEEILGPVASELGCITVLGTRKVTPLYTTLKGICHGGFDFLKLPKETSFRTHGEWSLKIRQKLDAVGYDLLIHIWLLECYDAIEQEKMGNEKYD